MTSFAPKTCQLGPENLSYDKFCPENLSAGARKLVSWGPKTCHMTSFWACLGQLALTA